MGGAAGGVVQASGAPTAYGPADATGAAAATRVPFDATERTTVQAASGNFSCTAQLALAPGAAARDDHASAFALLALEGGWFGGVLRSRSCTLQWCAGGDCAADPATPSADAFGATLPWEWVELRGDFAPTDAVLPFLATGGGQIVGNASAWEVGAGSLRVALGGRPLLHAMLLADTGSPQPVW